MGSYSGKWVEKSGGVRENRGEGSRREFTIKTMHVAVIHTAKWEGVFIVVVF